MEPDAFEDMLVTLLDIEASGDRVFVRQLVKARGAGSGIEIELIVFHRFLVHRGRPRHPRSDLPAA